MGYVNTRQGVACQIKILYYIFPSPDLKHFTFLSQLAQRIQEPVETVVHQFTARTMISSVPVAVLQQRAMSDPDKKLFYREDRFCAPNILNNLLLVYSGLE